MQVVSQSIVNEAHIETRQQWLIVGVFSLILHSGLVFWFSSLRPDFPTVDFSDFKVGLVASEGMGETLQASLPDVVAVSDIASEESGIVTQHDIVSEVIPKQALEVREELLPVEQALAESVELAAVVTPETSSAPDVSPPAISDIEKAVENQIEESRPIEAVEVIIPSAASVDVDVEETTGISAEFIEVAPVDSFFKPAEIVMADDPMSALPIEQLAAVPAPEAIQPDNNPELASDDVEILEIKARDVVAQRKSVPRSVASVSNRNSVRTGTGDDPLHPRQSPLASGREIPETSSASTPQKKKELPPLVVPKTYILELRKWLSEHKQYPAQAHRLKQEGVVIIGLVIDRSGEIISYDIKRSSGHQLLDQEVEKMIQRASKMPALPDGFPRDTLELLIPVRFKTKS